MQNPALKPYHPVLNALAEMVESKVYAVRAKDLQCAEDTIVSLAIELESVKAKLVAAQASAEQWDAHQALRKQKVQSFKRYVQESMK